MNYRCYIGAKSVKRAISVTVAILYILNLTGYSYAVSGLRVRMGEEVYPRLREKYNGAASADISLRDLLIKKKPEGQGYVEFLERHLADIESRNLKGGWDGVSYSTGMSSVKEAIFYLIDQSKVDPNKANLVVFRPSYACTDNLFTELEKVFDVRYVAGSEEVEGNLDENTVLVFCETVTNPTLKVIDVEKICEVIASRNRDITLVCDNTFATPLGMQPLRYAEEHNVEMLVMHGVTKGLSGPGNVLGGILIGRDSFIKGLRQRKKTFLRPLTEKDAEVTVEYGIPLLSLRLAIQNDSAKEYLRELKKRPFLDKVIYPGDPSHPQYDVAKRLMDNFGHMIYLDFGPHQGGRGKAVAFMNLLRYFRTLEHAVSLGQVRNLLNLASDATHITLSDEDKEQGGISPSGIRWSVGIEDPRDVLRELNAIFEILESYEHDPENIPYELLDEIFMAEYNDVSEGKTYLIRKYPVVNRVRNSYKIEPVIEDAIEKIDDKDDRVRDVAKIINEATLVTEYDAQTWLCHHGWLSSLISGNHSSVIDTLTDATSLRAKDAEDMSGRFTSILKLSEDKGPLQPARRGLYARLGTPSSLTLEIFIALLEAGALDAFSGKYVGLSASSLNGAIDEFFLRVIFRIPEKENNGPIKVISFTSEDTPLSDVTKAYRDGSIAKLESKKIKGSLRFDFTISHDSDEVLKRGLIDEGVDFVFVDEKRHSGLDTGDMDVIKEIYPKAKICWINTQGIKTRVQPIKAGRYNKGAYLSIVGLNDRKGNDIGAVMVIPYEIANSAAWTLKNTDRVMRPTEAHEFLVYELAYLLQDSERVVGELIKGRPQTGIMQSL